MDVIVIYQMYYRFGRFGRLPAIIFKLSIILFAVNVNCELKIFILFPSIRMEPARSGSQFIVIDYVRVVLLLLTSGIKMKLNNFRF